MKRDWIEDGWRRFLDRLKDLWGKRTGPPYIIPGGAPNAGGGGGGPKPPPGGGGGVRLSSASRSASRSRSCSISRCLDSSIISCILAMYSRTRPSFWSAEASGGPSYDSRSLGISHR